MWVHLVIKFLHNKEGFKKGQAQFLKGVKGRAIRFIAELDN